MKGLFNKKLNSIHLSISKKRGFNTKPVLSVLLVLAMIMTMLPAMTVAAWAMPYSSYYITNDGSRYVVTYNGTPTSYNSFSEALAACGSNITFGDGTNALQLGAGPGYALSKSGTYTGNVHFSVGPSGYYGLYIPQDIIANFSNLTISNTSTDFFSFSPVVVNVNGTLNIHTGTTISTTFVSTNDSYVVQNSGVLNVDGGTICGDVNTKKCILNNTGATLNVSGGTVKSEAPSDGVAILNKGDVTVSGGLISSKTYGIVAENSSAVTVTGGTVESTDTSTIGAAVNISSASSSTVTVSGGTIQSANDNTIKLAKGTADTAKIEAHGLNIYRSSKADLKITGVADSGKRVFSDTSATLNATDFNSALGFSAWTSDSAGLTSISTSNGATIANLLASSANVYLKTGPDNSDPNLTAGTVNRVSDAAGTVAFTSDEAGTYYYKVVANNADAPDITPDTPETYDGTGSTEEADAETTITLSSLTAGSWDIYISVVDEAENESDVLKMDIAPTGVVLTGEGTEASPYLVCTADQLDLVGANSYGVAAYYKLTADIDMTGRSWTPIGRLTKDFGEDDTSLFSGTFDGDNHIISNFTIDNAQAEAVGLFGFNIGDIENLKLVDVNITGGMLVGGLCGANAGTIKNCSVTGTVTNSATKGESYAGGLVGGNLFGTVEKCCSLAIVQGPMCVGGFVGIVAGGTFSECYANSDVIVSNEVGGGFAGVIAGMDDYGDIIVQECYARGTVSGEITTGDLAGFAGVAGNDEKDENTVTIRNCYSSAEVISGDAPQAFCGETEGEAFSNCFYDSETAGAPQTTIAGITGKTTDEMKTENTFTDATWNFTDIWAIDSAKNDRYPYLKNVASADSSFFSGGDGTSANPYQITTAEQLSKIGEYTEWDSPKSFILMNDINLGESAYKDGWNPIYGFYGTLDGNGKTISNMKCYTVKYDSVSLFMVDGTGLFSALSNGSTETTIKNLAITNAKVTGYNYVGILAGRADNIHVEEVYVTGEVKGSRYVGGLFGRFGASDKTILNCYSLATVSGSGVVGGLVGLIESSSITNSYAAGTVSIVNANTNSFGSEGKAYKDYIGGLVGADNPYVHEGDKNTFTSNYYDITVSGQTDTVGATGKTTAEMKTQSTFAGWDFSTVWAIDAGTNGGYPYLKVFKPSSSGGYVPDTATKGADVLVNGKAESIGTEKKSTENGKSVTTIALDQKKLDEKLEAAGRKAVVTIPVPSGSDVAVGELTGQMVKNMENKEAVLEIKTGMATYTLPASQINIDEVSAQLGSQVALKDIKVSVSIAEPPADTVKIVQDTANKNSYQLVVKPVEFEITCTSGGKTVDVSRFNGYVERTVAIPDGIDPAKITTGIVLNIDGTFSHVPTQIIKIDGKYYAKINSLTNSTYSVIYNPISFTDVANHWAKDAINDMGSRMVVTGVGSSTYEPNRSITRAEFAAVVVRALGLQKGTTESAFGDVTLTDWFNGYVDTATSYSLITGYDSTSYGPNDAITREQAMAIITRTMKIAGMNVSLTDSEESAFLSKYTDGASISSYAREGAAACLKAGIITGTSATEISPKDCVTRAEVAVMVQRLLQKSGLI